MLGSTIARYQVLEKLGEGGMGVVYRARDTQLFRDVALKVLSPQAMTGLSPSRVLREARAAAALNHVNLVHVYEVNEDRGIYFIAMELIEGETLRTKLDSPSVSVAELLRYLVQVAKALAQAHSRGIIHCDLKPKNIMVTTEGVAKVLDFGLARVMEVAGAEQGPASEGVTQTQVFSAPRSSIEGTVGYMSPEQAAGDLASDRSDVFSFGCMLFEGIAHRRPFAATSTLISLHQTVYQPVPRLSAFGVRVPAGMQNLVDGCLEKQRDRRPSMEEVAQQLEQIVEGLSSGSRQMPWFALAELRSRLLSQAKPITLVAVLLVALCALAALAFYRSRQAFGSHSIAVIPFANTTGSKDVEFLCDGISEDLINHLAQLPGLKMIARTSSFQFRNRETDARVMAARLGVRQLIMGRVARMGGQLRITAELIDGTDSTQTWGAHYLASISEAADTQARIVRDLAAQLRPDLPETKRLLALGQMKPINSEAYELMLRGRYEMTLYNPASTRKAPDYFREALALDPNYAVASAELASAYQHLGVAGILKPGDSLPLAEAAARRAIAIDPSLAQAHAALGDIKKDQWEWSTAEHEFQQALVLNPNLVAAHNGFGILLTLQHRYEAAFEENKRARDLDPINVLTAIDSAAIYYNSRRYKLALEPLDRATQLDPTAPALWTWKGIVLGGSGQYSPALAAYREAFRLGDKTAFTRCNYAYSLARSGERKAAAAELDDIQRSGEFVPPMALALVYNGLDQKGRALDALERAYRDRDPVLQYVAVESQLDSLRSDPRFKSLVSRIGLTP